MAELIPLGIDGAWLYQSEVFGDSRGFFNEWFKHELVKEKIGREFNITQANTSKSKRGVVRGIHFSIAKEGQAKWITCTSGSIIDFIVDVRPYSNTFKKWVSVELKAGNGASVLISEGLGHAFMSLEDETVLTYLLTSPYSPSEEFSINPNDQDIGIEWPLSEKFFSPRDQNAPTLNEIMDLGILN